MLEVMLNDPTYIYSKRTIYIDAVPYDQGGAYILYWGEAYDQKGRMWKADGHGAVSASHKEGFRNTFDWVYMNCLTDHYTSNDTVPAYVQDFDKIFPLDEEESFTIKGLLKKAR